MNRSIIVFCILFPMFALLALMNTIQAQASLSERQNATFTVNSTIDATDINPGDGICETATSNGICTLRGAIQESNSSSGTDTILLPSGTYTLTIPGYREDLAATGDLDIMNNLIIHGAGMTDTIISGGFIDRIFHIIESTNVEIDNVTITNGYIDESSGGGGILNKALLTLTHTAINNNIAESGLFGNDGGGIQNWGTLNLINSEIKFNYSADSGGGIHLNGGSSFYMIDSEISNNQTNSSGGGISSYAYYDTITATIINSTISKNKTGYSGSTGGGIRVGIRSSFVISNSTISENRASMLGGGISNHGGYLTITNSTIYSNTALHGGFNNSGPHAMLSNTIIANNWNSDCNANATETISTGFNLASDNSCPFTATGDIQNTDPLLSVLQDFGGPTPTHAPFANSPIIDKIPVGINGCGTSILVDQRGITRPQITACDIGSYEALPFKYSYLPTILKP